VIGIAFAVLLVGFPAAARDAATEQLSPRDQEARERYLELRADFLQLLREAEQRADASELSLAVTYYRSAEMRADRGFYSAALLDIQRALAEVQRILAETTDAGMADAAERQLDRLAEILAEAERRAAGVDADALRALLGRAYREEEQARRALAERRYRDCLNCARRGTQFAQEALRLAERGGADSEARLREHVDATLRTMDELVRKAASPPPPDANPDIPDIVREIEQTAGRAHEAAAAGHQEAALRFAERTIRLARLVLRETGRHDLLPPDRLLHELEGFLNLLDRGRQLAAERPHTAADRLLSAAEGDAAAAQQAIHQGEFDLARRRIREGTDKVIRALGLLGPGGETLEARAAEALRQLRARYLPAAETILREREQASEADAYLDRARALADQAETQIAAHQPLAALGSIRIAVELTIQAVRRSTVSAAPPPALD